MRRGTIPLTIGAVVLIGVGIWWGTAQPRTAASNANAEAVSNAGAQPSTTDVANEGVNSDAANTNVPAAEPSVVYPIAGFPDRITKKHFGQYITKADSPVQPERFSGYHAGSDAETTPAEADADVPVFAIADGTVLVRRTATGYGGVVLIAFTVNGETVTGVYGHMRLASVTRQVGQTVQRGERIGVLGTGFSSETDGERKHLHFALLKGRSTTLLGYVQSQSALAAWYDPEAWLRERGAVDPIP